MQTPPGWDRNLWGILMRSASDRPDPPNPILIGTAWHKVRENLYEGEPTRCLLFKTRKLAREWCKDAVKKYDMCRDWKFRVVKVRETVSLLEYNW